MRIRFVMQYGFAAGCQATRERSKKTEAVSAMQTQPAVCIARGGTKRQKIRSLAAQGFGDCQKTSKKSWNTEQQGKSEGGKEPPSRSINQFFELFQSSKNCLSGAKRLFRHAEKPRSARLRFVSFDSDEAPGGNSKSPRSSFFFSQYFLF